MNSYRFLEMRVDGKRKKMTQDELSQIIGIDRNRIQQLETSPKAIPKHEELKAYCDYFNTTSDYLLGLCNTKPKDEDIAMISKSTGLSDISIDRLKGYTKLQKDIVDKLLSTKAMDKIIDAYIYRNLQYLQKVEITDSICGKIPLSDKENSDYHLFQSVEYLKEAINIISNDKDLFLELTEKHGELAKERIFKFAVDMEITNIGIDATIKHLKENEKHVPDYIFDYIRELQKKQESDDW